MTRRRRRGHRAETRGRQDAYGCVSYYGRCRDCSWRGQPWFDRPWRADRDVKTHCARVRS